jgi:hypothetical protein
MKNFKVIVGVGMLACSTLAFAGKTWYTVGAVPEPYAVDSEGFDAEARFISQYNGGLISLPCNSPAARMNPEDCV